MGFFTSPVFLFFMFLVWGLPMLVGHVLGGSRGRTGWVWGCLLGWLGVLILACMRPIPVSERDANQQAERELWKARATEENPSGIWPPPPTR